LRDLTAVVKVANGVRRAIMHYPGRSLTLVLAGLVAMLVRPVSAADYPAPAEGDWSAQNFRFQSGETLPELRMHYTTIGNPAGEKVLILHGTAGSGAGLLTPSFAGVLFGKDQPLDAQKYFIVLPDAVGAGKSSKPSDGLGAKFPHYSYDDMVRAQYLLVHEGLGLQHLRLVFGYSMGGMHTWLWGVTYPGFMDALVPMAAQPAAMSGRNWMLRRALIEAIRRDPAYENGNYLTPPPSLVTANLLFGIATSGGTLAWQSLAPTSAAGDRLVMERLDAPMTIDANDFIYQWESSRDYDPSAKLGDIRAPVLAINSADDERNPPETGVMVRGLAQVKNAQLLLVPASALTRGHGTLANAAFFQRELGAFLQSAPKQTN
jgi:homoserine O-acetyltransferase